MGASPTNDFATLTPIKPLTSDGELHKGPSLAVGSSVVAIGFPHTVDSPLPLVKFGMWRCGAMSNT